jgi:hypothetical protein
MVDIEDITNSTAFWVLCGVGYGAFAIMIIVLRSMEQSSIMPFWVKLVTIILIPIISAAFSGYAESG